MPLWILLALLATLAAGCLRTRVKLTSEPSGALVRVNGETAGYTPLDMNINWYWHYDYEVEKAGYFPLKQQERYKAPLWAVMPLDFFAEILPVPILDQHYTTFQLKPIPQELDEAALFEEEK